MKRMPRKDVAKFRDNLHTEVQAVLDKALRTLDSYPDNLDLAQAVYEVWSRHMGALDALMSLRLVPQDVRLRTMLAEIAHGKEVALQAHKTFCEGCDGVDQLQSELATEPTSDSRQKKLVH